MDHKSLEYSFNRNNLNMRQRRWLELFKDYDYSINYDLGKANVVTNALKRKSSNSLASLHTTERQIIFDLERMES